jgi:chromate transport protein ChrA
MLYAVNVIRYDLLTGILAFFVWSLPMACVAFGLSLGIEQVGEQLPDPVYALLCGLNSATVGIIALAAYQLSQKAITDTTTRVLVFLGGAAGMLYNALWFFPLLMAGGGIVTVVIDLKFLHSCWKLARPKRREVTPQSVHVELGPASQDGEHSGVRARQVPYRPSSERPLSNLSSETTQQAQRTQDPSHPSVIHSWKFGLCLLSAFFLAFIVVMVCRGIFGGDSRGFDLFANLWLAGTIIFGGGPVSCQQ